MTLSFLSLTKMTTSVSLSKKKGMPLVVLPSPMENVPTLNPNSSHGPTVLVLLSSMDMYRPKSLSTQTMGMPLLVTVRPYLGVHQMIAFF